MASKWQDLLRGDSGNEQPLYVFTASTLQSFIKAKCLDQDHWQIALDIPVYASCLNATSLDQEHLKPPPKTLRFHLLDLPNEIIAGIARHVSQLKEFSSTCSLIRNLTKKMVFSQLSWPPTPLKTGRKPKNQKKHFWDRYPVPIASITQLHLNAAAWHFDNIQTARVLGNDLTKLARRGLSDSLSYLSISSSNRLNDDDTTTVNEMETWLDVGLRSLSLFVGLKSVGIWPRFYDRLLKPHRLISQLPRWIQTLSLDCHLSEETYGAIGRLEALRVLHVPCLGYVPIPNSSWGTRIEKLVVGGENGFDFRTLITILLPIASSVAWVTIRAGGATSLDVTNISPEEFPVLQQLHLSKLKHLELVDVPMDTDTILTLESIFSNRASIRVLTIDTEDASDWVSYLHLRDLREWTSLRVIHCPRHSQETLPMSFRSIVYIGATETTKATWKFTERDIEVVCKGPRDLSRRI